MMIIGKKTVALRIPSINKIAANMIWAFAIFAQISMIERTDWTVHEMKKSLLGLGRGKRRMMKLPTNIPRWVAASSRPRKVSVK